MKKVIFGIIMILFLTGCTKINKRNNDYSAISSMVINNKDVRTNANSLGFKFHLSKGVIITDRTDTNIKFNVLGYDMYLYVDLVSYYYKKNNEYKNNGDNIYYNNLVSIDGKKTGYIEIKKENLELYLEIVYNYAKIEVYTNEGSVHDVLAYAMIIINSIEYNQVAIEQMINKNYFSSKQRNYYLKQPKETESNSLEYLGGTSNYESQKLPD